MLTAEYGKPGEFEWRRVVVDPEAGTVVFHRCHMPRQFLSWGVDPEFRCALSELRGVRWNLLQWRGWVLEIVTPSGVARLPQGSRGFEAVHAALVEGLPPGARLRWFEHPAVKTLLLGPGLVLAVLLGLVLLLLIVGNWPAPAWSALGLLIIIAAAILSRRRGQPHR